MPQTLPYSMHIITYTMSLFVFLAIMAEVQAQSTNRRFNVTAPLAGSPYVAGQIVPVTYTLPDDSSLSSGKFITDLFLLLMHTILYSVRTSCLFHFQWSGGTFLSSNDLRQRRSQPRVQFPTDIEFRCLLRTSAQRKKPIATEKGWNHWLVPPS